MISVNDLVRIKDNVWHCGCNISGKRGIVIDTKGHVLVEVPSYENNPIKLFTYEVELLYSELTEDDIDDNDINKALELFKI